MADDSPVSRRILTGMLQQHCDIMEVVTIDDGAAALERINLEKFDVVLLDWHMPGMTGLEVLTEIRKQGLNTPIIMVTAEKEKTQVLAAFKAGANDYIMKPFEPRQSAVRILNVLAYARHAAERAPSQMALVVDDSPLVRKILANTLRRECRFQEIMQVGDGKLAVEAAKENDFDLILLDWNMPEMTGIEALRAIREFRKRTPIVMVTSENDGARVVEALDAGANNYIIKPIEPQTLSEKIRQIMLVHG